MGVATIQLIYPKSKKYIYLATGQNIVNVEWCVLDDDDDDVCVSISLHTHTHTHTHTHINKHTQMHLVNKL